MDLTGSAMRKYRLRKSGYKGMNINRNEDYRRFEDDSRVKEIANKWTNLREGIQKGRKMRADALEEYLNDLERRLGDQLGDLATKNIKKNIHIMEDDISHEKTELEILEDDQQKKLVQLEENFTELIEELKISQGKWSGELTTQIDEKIYNLNLNFSKIRKSNQDTVDTELQNISNGLNDMKEAIEEERLQREMTSEQTVAQIQTSLNRLEEEIEIEQKVREETTEKLSNLITDMENRLMNTIDNERKEREMTSGSLLNLLEEACSKIERNFTANYL